MPRSIGIAKTCPNFLIEGRAFAIVGDKITGYALDQAIKEWSTTKIMADEIEEDHPEELHFILGTECKLGCKLPLWYSLPCKHWLYKAFVDDVPIPLSIFHPCWLLDGPLVLHKRWFVS
jgi:hypothetical protein